MRDGGAAAIEDREEIDFEHRLPNLRVDIGCAAIVPDTGVVEHDVQTPEMLDRGGGEDVDLLDGAHVDAIERRLLAQFTGECLARLLVQIAQHQLRSFGCEAARRGGTDPRCGARDEDYLARESSCHTNLLALPLANLFPRRHAEHALTLRYPARQHGSGAIPFGLYMRVMIANDLLPTCLCSTDIGWVACHRRIVSISVDRCVSSNKTTASGRK